MLFEQSIRGPLLQGWVVASQQGATGGVLAFDACYAKRTSLMNSPSEFTWHLHPIVGDTPLFVNEYADV